MVEHPEQHSGPTPPQGYQFPPPAQATKSRTSLLVGVIAAVVLFCCGGLTLVATLSGKPNPAPKAAAATDHSSPPSRSSSPTASAAATVPIAAPLASIPPVVTTTTPAAPPVVRTTNPAPKPKPTTKPPTQAADLCGAPTNPYGYNFCGGSYIYNPPSDICSYLSCIANFWNGRGYIEECQDGMFSKSGGIQGSCSYHHGNRQPLFSR